MKQNQTHPQISDGGIGAIIERVQKKQGMKVKPNYANVTIAKRNSHSIKSIL